MSMKRKRHTEPQTVCALQQAKAGTPVGELCRKSRARAVICGWLTKAHAGAIMDGFLAR